MEILFLSHQLFSSPGNERERSGWTPSRTPCHSVAKVTGSPVVELNRVVAVA
jgi:predicted RNA polymerase sigma factor